MLDFYQNKRQDDYNNLLNAIYTAEHELDKLSYDNCNCEMPNYTCNSCRKIDELITGIQDMKAEAGLI